MTSRMDDSQLSTLTVLGSPVRVSVRPGTETGRRPLLLCNGIGASLDLLQPFVRDLDPRLTVVTFDVPGVGSSPLPRVPYSFATLATFTSRMMTQLGFDRFDVLGISWGGGLAQQLAFQKPGRVRRVVLVATATGSLMVPARPQILAKMLTPRRYRDHDYAQRIAAELYGGRMRAESARAWEVLHENSRVGSRRGYLYQLLAGVGWSSLPVLPLITQPVLVLAGRDDPIVPLVNARIMTRLLPDATLHIYDDGHLGLVTASDELAPVVADFLLTD